ncbi:MAG: hypothetical protein AAGJ91_14590 [Pseudomonadota bacterium]
MRNVSYLPVAILGVALVGTGIATAHAQGGSAQPPVVAAQADGRPGPAARGAHDGDARMWRASRRDGGRGGFMRGLGRDLFDTVDTDGDRSVTRTEIDTYRAATLERIDVSGDGALSIEEFDTLYRELTRAQMVDAFQNFDGDGDGAITSVEVDRIVDRFVERMDRDGDGALTLQRRGGDDE